MARGQKPQALRWKQYTWYLCLRNATQLAVRTGVTPATSGRNQQQVFLCSLRPPFTRHQLKAFAFSLVIWNPCHPVSCHRTDPHETCKHAFFPPEPKVIALTSPWHQECWLVKGVDLARAPVQKHSHFTKSSLHISTHRPVSIQPNCGFAFQTPRSLHRCYLSHSQLPFLMLICL